MGQPDDAHATDFHSVASDDGCTGEGLENDNLEYSDESLADNESYYGGLEKFIDDHALITNFTNVLHSVPLEYGVGMGDLEFYYFFASYAAESWIQRMATTIC